MINLFRRIKCENCGILKSKEKIKLINIGKEQFYICNECIDTINKFKQRHEI